MLGSILLVLVVIVAVTGFLSHAAYQPDLGNNAIVPPRDLPLRVLRLADAARRGSTRSARACT